MDELVGEFLTETNEGLAELDIALVRLERTPGDQATLQFIFRLVHTIKGTCGFLALPRLERVAHAAETVLGRIRDGALPPTPDAIATIITGLDRIRLIVADIAACGTERPGDDTAVIAALDAAAAGSAVETLPPPELAPEPAPDPAAHTIRLPIDTLEQLMTLVSELVLNRNQLLQVARQAPDSRYGAPLERLSQITSDLQEGVMRTRMQPIGQAWNKLPRLVRDLGRELGKPIELVLRGAETELDRQVLELIRDPLMHMVRNSADHGLEPAATRLAAGKPAAGTITLTASHAGGSVLLEVADDGAGLSTGRIRDKALARGLATEAELAAMTERQVQRFIFHAGFSTAAAVSAVSGRGVGMDVVKTNIERIGGTIDIDSVAGRGTAFTIRIPLTLAIVAALIVQVGGARFAVPQPHVVELVGHAAIERVGGTPVMRLRGRLLPLVDLGALLQLDAQAAGRDQVVVVMAVGAASVGLLVDRVSDTEEIVVKPVSTVLRHVPLFGGNAILGDGAVIMVLDPPGIARAAGIGTAASAPPDQAAEDAAEQTGARIPLLSFRRTPSGPPCAVPLALVARIEEVARTAIEWSSGRPVTQYRGQLIPLLPVDHEGQGARQTLLVFSDRGRSMGLMVDGVLDATEAELAIQLASPEPGLLGSAVVDGRATDILDAAYWMTQAWGDWFVDAASGPAHQSRKRLLVVEDSAFFRQLLVPALSAAGYHVLAVDSAAKALALQREDAAFDAVISDIEMPDMDGLAFARRLRAAGPWRGLPLIALSGRAAPEDAARGRAAGFTDYVAKFEREPLLASLQRCLAPPADPLALECAA